MLTPDFFRKHVHGSSWNRNLAEVPDDFSMKELKTYLIDSKDRTFDRKSVRAFKSLKAYRYFQDGYVQKIYTTAIVDQSVSSEKLFMAKCKVMASMKRLVYDVAVCLDVNGKVLGGTCNCVAGKGEACSHVAALLFAIEDFVAQGLQETPDQLTCTEKLKQWNVPAKRAVQYGTIDKINIYRPELGKKKEMKEGKPDPRHLEDREVNATALSTLHTTMMKLVPKCGFSKYAVPAQREPDCNQESTSLFQALPPSKTDIKEACVTFFTSLPNTAEEINAIEQQTLRQSQSGKWHKERHIRITASNFHSVVNRREATDPTPLMKKLLGFTSVSTRAMRFGLEYEERALARYAEKMKRKGLDDIQIDKCGFRISAAHPHLGASADGIASDSQRGRVLVEVKTPSSTWGDSMVDAAMKLPCLKLDENNRPYLNPKHSYFTQVQGQMAVYNIHVCDFVLCTEKDLFIESVLFDAVYWASVVPKLTSFYKTFILPELVYPTIKHGYPVLQL